MPSTVNGCVPVIPSADLEKSLRFWVDGLGLTADREVRRENKLIGCMVHNDRISFWLNEREGIAVKPDNYESIRLYLTPSDIHETWKRLKHLGYEVSEIEDRDYDQREFFVTDNDGYSHCFGVAINN